MTENSETHDLMGKSSALSDLALDFAPDAIKLCVCDEAGNWSEIGRAELGASDFSEQIDALRVEYLVRAKGKKPVTLWLPAEQILERRYMLLAEGEVARRLEAARRMATETEYSAEELSVSIAQAAGGQTSVVLGALLQTVEEARNYAIEWGFTPGAASTRVRHEMFAPKGAIFPLPLSTSAKAWRGVQKMAVAATVLIAVAGSAYGGFVALKPLLAERLDVNSAGPAAASFSVFQDSFRSNGSPLSAVNATVPGGLALQGVALSDDDFRIELSASRPAVFAESINVPDLTPPGEPVPMKIGYAPELPNRVRPGRLGDVDRSSAPRSNSELKPVETAINKASGALPDPTDEAEQLAALAPQTDKTPIANPAKRSGKSPSQADPAIENSLDPETSDEETARDTAVDAGPPSKFAPEKMGALPKARPTLPGTQTAANAPETAPATNQPEAQIANTVIPETPETASSNEASLAALPQVKQTPELEDSSFAALNAPEPSKRPRTLQRLVKKNRKTPAAYAAVKVPRNVRTAALKHGLELDQTSLIGVIDARTGRRALVRMATGDYKKVRKGDLLDGWRVSSISREAMRLTRQGQNRTLLLVSR